MKMKEPEIRLHKSPQMTLVFVVGIVLSQQIRWTMAECYDVKAVLDGEEVQGICRELYNNTECQPYAKTMKRSDLPAGFPKGDSDIQEPRSIEVIGTLIQKNTLFLPALTVRWEPPRSGNARDNLNGYLIMWSAGPGGHMACVIIELDKRNPKFNSKNLKFQYDNKGVLPLKNYTVSLYSLPAIEEPNVEDTFQKGYFTSGKLLRYTLSPSEWTTSVSFNGLNTGTVNVRFTYAPPMFNLTFFEVELIMWLAEDSETVVATKNHTGTAYSSDTQYGEVKFHGLDTGRYRASVRPLDHYPLEKNKCLCWNERRDNCNNICSMSSTDWLMLNVTEKANASTPAANTSTLEKPEKDSSLDGSENGSHKVTEIVIYVASSLLVLIVIFSLVTFCIRRFRDHEENTRPTQEGQMYGQAVSVPTKKIVDMQQRARAAQ